MSIITSDGPNCRICNTPVTIGEYCGPECSASDTCKVCGRKGIHNDPTAVGRTCADCHTDAK